MCMSEGPSVLSDLHYRHFKLVIKQQLTEEGHLVYALQLIC
jgi:hypothetical protein